MTNTQFGKIAEDVVDFIPNFFTEELAAAEGDEISYEQYKQIMNDTINESSLSEEAKFVAYGAISFVGMETFGADHFRYEDNSILMVDLFFLANSLGQGQVAVKDVLPRIYEATDQETEEVRLVLAGGVLGLVLFYNED